MTPLAKALIAANPQRINWGSDWPHPAQIAGRKITEITPLYQIDDGRDLNQLASWTSGPAQLKGDTSRESDAALRILRRKAGSRGCRRITKLTSTFGDSACCM